MKQVDIRLRLYKTVLFAGIAFSVINVIGNFISDFPFEMNYKWIAFFVISIIALHYTDNERVSSHIMFGVFLIIIFIFLPIGYFASGGAQNNASGYALAFLITISFIFVGKKRLFLVGALTLVFVGLQITEFYYPTLVSVYSRETQFIDHMIQIPLLIIICFVVLNLFSKEYERVNQKLSLYATRDELTGLYNRRAFNRSMDEIKETAESDAHLVMLDLDNFKMINDLYGHHTGDAVLIKLADLLKREFDLSQHMVSRWGGDEFAIIYYGDLQLLSEKLNVVQETFEDYVKKYNETTGVTLSIISLRNYNSGSEGLVAADHMLYAEKRKKSNSR
ncbi:GGDEF domain-containing protein [Fusibacter bizertensis]